MNEGWIKLHRSIMDHWVWGDRPFSKGQAWIDLLLLANHKETKIPYKDNVITGERGTVYRSISSLSERWGWAREKTRRFISQLESDGMITANVTRHQTTLTIVNYGNFQDWHTTDTTTNRQQIDNKSTTNRQQIDINNNVKNVKNEKNVVVVAPTPDDSELRKIMDAWNEIPHVVKIQNIVPMTSRYDELRVVLSMVGIDGVMEGIRHVRDSTFLKNRGNVVFDRYINRNAVQGLLEGAYDTDYREGEKHGSCWDN